MMRVKYFFIGLPKIGVYKQFAYMENHFLGNQCCQVLDRIESGITFLQFWK